MRNACQVIAARVRCWLHCRLRSLTERHVARYDWYAHRLSTLDCSCGRAFYPAGRVLWMNRKDKAS